MSTLAKKRNSQTAPAPGKQAPNTFRKFADLLKDAAVAWYAHNPFRYAAALAFYTVISLAPLVVVAVGVAGLVFGGADAARDQLLAQLSDLVGDQGAAAVRIVLDNAQNQNAGIASTVIGVGAFLAAVVAVYFEIQAALNALWGIQPDPNQSLAKTLGKMFFSCGLIVVFGFLLLVSLVVSAALTAVDRSLMGWQPELVVLWQVINVLIGFGITLLLFALLFKYVPDADIAFRDVWVGAAATALLFTIGKVLIGLYLGQSGVASSYGAAGSIVVLLLWLYYSSLILFFGAELTQKYADRFGNRVRPAAGAAPISAPG